MISAGLRTLSNCIDRLMLQLMILLVCDYLVVYFSALGCWLGGRKGIRPAKKTEWWGAGVVICLERGADLHMAQLKAVLFSVLWKIKP